MWTRELLNGIFPWRHGYGYGYRYGYGHIVVNASSATLVEVCGLRVRL